MKHFASTLLLPTVGLLALSTLPVRAQTQGPTGNRAYNPFNVAFQRVWEITLDAPVKLVEIGPVSGDKNSVLLLVGGKDKNDYKRQLRVTHWDGFRLATDFTTDFIGTSQDALLLGHFRTGKTLASLKPAKGKAPGPPTRQIVTTEGVYENAGGSYARLFPAPAQVALAVSVDKSPDQLLAGMGDSAVLYEVGDNDAHPSALESPSDGAGSVRFGIGNQELANPASLDFTSGVRAMQTYWSNRNRWMIGLLRGQPAGLTETPNATTGDRIVVYTPKLNNRDRAFWALKPADFEESWRSDPLPGLVLDVRVGDPKNEGKDGLLVLTADKDGRTRHLYFYKPTQAL